jgi:hypothetical protein
MALLDALFFRLRFPLRVPSGTPPPPVVVFDLLPRFVAQAQPGTIFLVFPV